MAKQSRKMPKKEKRLKPKEFEDALLRLEKSPPDVVDEPEYRRRLRQTTIHRYEVALDLLSDVEELLLTLGKSGNAPLKEQVDFAIEEIDQAVVQMTHGSLKFNKGAVSGIRSVLSVKRPDDGLTPEQRMARILGEEK